MLNEAITVPFLVCDAVYFST